MHTGTEAYRMCSGERSHGRTEPALEDRRGGREWAEMTEGIHLEVTRHKC
jgi:hypothetical protein